MNHDDEAAVSEDEQREAAALADSLDHRARGPQALPPALEVAVMAKVAPLLDARRADDRRRRRLRLAAVGTFATAAAALALVLLPMSSWLSAPRVAATTPPAPPADLLAAQARVAHGGGAAIAALDVEMRSYRRHYHDELLRRRGRRTP
jgi:hypothetical protein